MCEPPAQVCPPSPPPPSAGVEFAGSLSDFLREDLKKKFPLLMPFVRVSLLNAGQAILGQFAASLQQRALDNFQKTGVEVSFLPARGGQGGGRLPPHGR